MHINDVLRVSVERSNRWHNGNLNNWSTLEWTAAMAGEAGETCNAAKKLKRLEDKIPSINEVGRNFTEVEEAKKQIANELADTILYALCVSASIGVTDLESVIREVFNRKSAEYNFPERL